MHICNSKPSCFINLQPQQVQHVKQEETVLVPGGSQHQWSRQPELHCGGGRGLESQGQEYWPQGVWSHQSSHLCGGGGGSPGPQSVTVTGLTIWCWCGDSYSQTYLSACANNTCWMSPEMLQFCHDNININIYWCKRSLMLLSLLSLQLTEFWRLSVFFCCLIAKVNSKLVISNQDYVMFILARS